MYEMLLLESSQVGGAGRFMFEHAGGGQPASNVGTDYKKLFENAGDVSLAKQIRPGAHGAIAGDLVVLNLLC